MEYDPQDAHVVHVVSGHSRNSQLAFARKRAPSQRRAYIRIAPGELTHEKVSTALSNGVTFLTTTVRGCGWDGAPASTASQRLPGPDPKSARSTLGEASR